MVLEGELLLMKSAILLLTFLQLRRCLFSLGGIMALAAVSVSGTAPIFVRLAAQRDKTMEAKPVVNDAQTSPVVAAHTLRSRSAAKLKPASSGSKTTKGMDRKATQATVALTGRKDHCPVDGVTAVPGTNNSSGRNSNNSKEESLCNPEIPRSH